MVFLWLRFLALLVILATLLNCHKRRAFGGRHGLQVIRKRRDDRIACVTCCIQDFQYLVVPGSWYKYLVQVLVVHVSRIAVVQLFNASTMKNDQSVMISPSYKPNEHVSSTYSTVYDAILYLLCCTHIVNNTGGIH